MGRPADRGCYRNKEIYCTNTEKAMAAHSSTLAWKISGTEEPGRLQSMGLEESDTTERLHFHFSLSCIGEGNGDPLQCSYLGNPRDGGAWSAAVCGVTQSRTRLKWLNSSNCTNNNTWCREHVLVTTGDSFPAVFLALYQVPDVQGEPYRYDTPQGAPVPMGVT